jgi:very-short-patch-repair endonuclease
MAHLGARKGGSVLSHAAVNALLDSAGDRYGLVLREQLLPLLGHDGIKRWLRSGRLIAVHRAVYRLVGVPVTDEQRLLAAVLAAGDGALASHRSAAWLWRILPTYLLPIEPEITVPSPRRPRLARVIVHRSLDLHSERPSTRRMIPVTNPLVTVMHLGAVVGDEALEDAIDLGLHQRLFTIAGLRALHARFGRSGRNGAGALWRVLDERALGDRPPAGLLEPRMARLLKAHGLPPAVFQHPVKLGGRRYRIDFAYPDQRIAIEVDGEEGHASKRQRQHDLTRQNDLVEAGWTVLRFTWDDVVLRPHVVARRIRWALAQPACPGAGRCEGMAGPLPGGPRRPLSAPRCAMRTQARSKGKNGGGVGAWRWRGVR